MITINNVSEKIFSLNGIYYVKNFLSYVYGNKLCIYNAYDRTDERVSLSLFSDFVIDGATFTTPAEVQEALINVLYTRNSLGSINTFFLGSITPTSPNTSIGKAFWIATEPGPYPNHGGVVVNANSRAEISRDAAGAFTISQTPLDITGKVNVSDVVNNLNSNSTVFPLSAAQGTVVRNKINEVTGLVTGVFPTGTSVGNQAPNVYLSLQATSVKYSKVDVETTATANIHFVQYRLSGGVYTLINSTSIVNGTADISSFVFQIGDWMGQTIISGTGGTRFVTTGGNTKWFAGNGTIITASIAEGSVATIAFVFSIKATLNSVIDTKITANNASYYTKTQIDPITNLITLGTVFTDTVSNQTLSVYLPLQAQLVKYDSVEVNTNSADILFVQYRLNAGVYTLINSTPIVNGTADISAFVFVVGDWVGTKVLSGTGGVHYNLTGGNTKSFASAGSTVLASVAEASVTASALSFAVRLLSLSKIDAKIIANNLNYYTKDDIAARDSFRFKKVGKIVYTNFRNSNFPSPWTAVGFTASANGMVSTGAGITTMIEYVQNSYLDSTISLFKFNATSLSSVLLANYYNILNLGGHVVKFDMIANTITVYEGTLKGALPTNIIIQKTIPFTCAVGDTIVRYDKDAQIETYTIVNNQNSFSFTFDTRTVPTYTGGGYDKFGLVLLSGAITITEGQYSCQMNAEPDIFIIGDSITNGDVMRSDVGGGYRKRWSGIVTEATSVSQYAIGGNDTSFAFRDRNFYFGLFKPKKAIYALGINDTDFAIYQGNVEAFIFSCTALGIEPILITLQPRADRVAFCTQASDYVKASGYRYIDWRKTLTVDGLGVTLDTSLFYNDLIHPNVLGNAKMALEVINTLEL